MRVNSINSAQPFGMALKINPEAVKIIKSRINEVKAPEIEIGKLEKLIKENASNKFNIEVDLASGRQLSAYIADGKTYCSPVKKEGIFDSLFKSPIKFLRLMTEDANKVNRNSKQVAKIDELLK